MNPRKKFWKKLWILYGRSSGLLFVFFFWENAERISEKKNIQKFKRKPMEGFLEEILDSFLQDPIEAFLKETGELHEGVLGKFS